MRHTTKQIEGVAKKLRKLPAVANKSPAVAKNKGHTPKSAVQTVQDELVKLLASGYSVAEVGNVLRSAGIQVSAVTLRGYARHASAAANKRASVAPPVKKKVATQKSPARSASSESAAAGNAPAARKNPAAAPATAKARPAAPKQPTKSGRGFHDYGTLQLAKSTFVVRPDTPDSDL